MKISVIIASYNSSKTIERCLSALEKQDNSQDFEVIVVDSSTDNTAEIVSRKFPSVKLYKFYERKYPGDARNFGVANSSGEILAFTDADCIVVADWVKQLIIAHEFTQLPVIGGAITNGNPSSYVGWGYYFCSLSQWMPQPQEFERTDIPTGCLSAKRWSFEKYGPFLEGSLCEDTLFNWKLAEAGYNSLFIPSIQVAHINIEDLKVFLSRKIQHGKIFAQLRVKEKKFSNFQRIFYIYMSPLLPLVILYRRTQDVLRSRIYIKQFILAFPLVLLGTYCWCYGEFLGYLFNSGASQNK
ncbi:MAG: glycosyltransferase [Cyanobacteria bacterium P01_A01_bin.40]